MSKKAVSSGSSERRNESPPHVDILRAPAGTYVPGRENDAECVISRIEDADGGIVTLRAFRVFPGITLIYRDVDTRGRIVPPEPERDRVYN